MKRTAFLLALISLPTLATDKNQLPELKTQVEADWGNLTSGYVVDVAEVELGMLPSGEPFSVSSIVTLPDPVVRALAQWRFTKYRKDGKDVPFTMFVKVPIRRPADADYERLQIPDFRNHGDAYRAMTAALQLTPEKAERALKKLPKVEDDAHTRASLLAYYVDKGSLADPAAARKIRAALISWFLANDPENRVLNGPLAIINPSPDNAEIAALTEQWLGVLKQHPANRELTNSAINFLRLANPPVALQVINALPISSRRSNWLGYVRALSGIGVTAISPAKGAFTATASAKLPDAELAVSSRKALLVSTDASEVISAMFTSMDIAQDLVNAHATIPQGYDEFCQALLKHARELFPQTHADCQRPEPSAPGVLKEGQLVNKVQPLYPPQARERGLQGTVTFEAVISKDGAPHNLEFVGGNLAFYDESRKAALQWRWQPTLFNGSPVDVRIEIVIHYVGGSLVEIYVNTSPQTP